MRSVLTNFIKKVDTWLHHLIDYYLFEVGIALIFLASFLIRLHLMPITMLSGDYNDSLIPWIEQYRQFGIGGGLATVIGNYYVPYNVFLAVIAFLPGQPWAYIAGFSVLMDYVTALFIYRIAKELGRSRQISLIAAAVSLLLPATIMNGALWKQCDSIYTCFLVISLYFAVKKNFNASLLILGISLIFKLQGIFMLPLFLLLYIIHEKRLSIVHFLWLPFLYLVGGLPAVLAGRRWQDVYDIYLRQSNQAGFDAMTIGMPNIYSFGLSDYPALKLPAILITICIFIFMACHVHLCRRKTVFTCQPTDGGAETLSSVEWELEGLQVYRMAIWCIWTCVMFLPAQHERYNFAVLVLLSTYYVMTDLKKCWPAIVINGISCLQYGSYLFGASMPDERILAALHLAAYLYVTADFVQAQKVLRQE